MKPQVTPNFLDRIVTFVSPRAGLRRIAAREMLAVYGSYVGARVDRRETMGWMPRAGNADADSLLDLRILRARSRDLIRNAPLAPGALAMSSRTRREPGLVLSFSAAVGNRIPSMGGSRISFLAGGGIKYGLTNSLSWQTLQAQYGQFRSNRFAFLSTGLAFSGK